MTRFKLSIDLLDENISSYKELKNKCLSDIGTIYGTLENTDTAWNDATATTFMKMVMDDKHKIDEYFKKIDALYKQTQQLMDGFENLLFKYGYNEKGVLKFNDENYDLCIRSLNSVGEYLERALYYVNCCNFKLGLSTSDKVFVLRSEIKKIKLTVNDIIEQINGFRNSTLKILSDNSSYVKKIGNVELDIKPIMYNFQVNRLVADGSNFKVPRQK